jgi:hypothetical protein
MIPIILILIIAVIITIIIDKPWDVGDLIMDVLFGLAVGWLVAGVHLAIQCTANIAEPVEQQISEPLVNIADTSYPDTHGSIRGGLFYIYGSISTDNKQAFNYYVKQADGSFKLKSAPASDSTIIYTKDNPRVEISAYKCERGEIISEAWSISGCKEKPTTYKFYIPEGSITESYALGGKE